MQTSLLTSSKLHNQATSLFLRTTTPIRGSNSGKGRGICVLQTCPDRLWGPASHSMETGVHSQGVKRQGREADHSPPRSAQTLKTAVPMIHLDVFIAWKWTTLPLYLRSYGNPNADHMRNDMTEKDFIHAAPTKIRNGFLIHTTVTGREVNSLL